MSGKKAWVGWASMCAAALLLILLVAPASARVEKVFVEGVSASCYDEILEVRDAGNTQHIKQYARNEVVAWNVDTDEFVDALAGSNDVWLDITVNLNTGRATYHGTFNFHPFTIPDGEWFGTFSGWVAPNGIDSHYLVVANGAGSLDKWHMQMTEEGIPEIPPGVDLCGEGEPQSVRRIEGYIRMPVD